MLAKIGVNTARIGNAAKISNDYFNKPMGYRRIQWQRRA
jgi:hypothetical protein